MIPLFSTQASANCPGVIPSDFACFASSLEVTVLHCGSVPILFPLHRHARRARTFGGLSRGEPQLLVGRRFCKADGAPLAAKFGARRARRWLRPWPLGAHFASASPVGWNNPWRLHTAGLVEAVV